MRELTIAGRRIADDTPCYVIAELGSNHQGSVATAIEMIQACASAGVDAVKLQKRENATLYTPDLLATPYEGEQSFGATYGAHRAALEFGWKEYVACVVEATHHHVPLFATAFDERSADFLHQIGVPAFKIASGGLTDASLLTHVAAFGKPVIVSTGGGDLADVQRAVAVIRRHHSQIAVLHCTAAYPATFEALNLRVIETYRRVFPDLVIGWSCHIHNLSMAIAAATLGASVLEVHMTLNRAMKGTDHAFSMEPSTLKKLVKDMQRVQVAIGDGVKRWHDSERGPISKMRRVLTPDGLRIAGRLSATSTAPSAAPWAAPTSMPNPIGTALPTSMPSTDEGSAS